jgi:hypothetical protein
VYSSNQEAVVVVLIFITNVEALHGSVKGVTTLLHDALTNNQLQVQTGHHCQVTFVAVPFALFPLSSFAFPSK